MRNYNVTDHDGNKRIVTADSRNNAFRYFDRVAEYDFVVSAIRAMAHVFN